METGVHRLINGDARDLSFLEDESVHLVIPSPPYWNLKRYNENPGAIGNRPMPSVRNDRHSIGVEIDPEYCRMAAAYLKAEGSDLFSKNELIFEKIDSEHAYMVREDQTLYKVRPAKRKL
ncbi:MAG: hypothetical protein AB1585_06940 [Thermodesulfobacteriota bacterium]